MSLLADFEMAKVMPQAPDLEQAVLGAIIIEGDAIETVGGILNANCFYKNANALIWETLIELRNASSKIDFLTVPEHLKSKNKLAAVGGISYISELTNKVASSANIETHARILYQKYMQRELIRISTIAITRAYEDTTDVFDLYDSVTTELASKVLQKQQNFSTSKQIIEKIKKGILLGQPIAEVFNVGFGDRQISKKTFNVIGAFQGTGKTAAMLSIARYIESVYNKPVGIFSIEMSEGMLGAKMIQEKTGINAQKIISANLSDEEKNRIFNVPKFSERIIVDECANLNSQNIVQKISQMVSKYGVEVVMIDYLQIMEIIEKFSTEVKGMEILTNKLQRIAKELDIAIIGLSQLVRSFNRSGEVDKPTAQSLRGGGIEQAASNIWILFDEHYKETHGKPWLEIPENIRGKLLLINAKARYGETDNQTIYFDKPHQRMEDWNLNEIPYIGTQVF